MRFKLLQDKEGQLTTSLAHTREEIIKLRKEEDSIKQSISILQQRLRNYRSQIERAQAIYHKKDRELAYLNGRFQELKPKKPRTRSTKTTSKSKANSQLKDLNKDQLAYLISELEELKEKENG